MCENLSLRDLLSREAPIVVAARRKWFKLWRNSSIARKWSKRGWRPGRGGAPLPSPSGAVPIGPSVPIRDRPTKPFRAPPSPSEARQVAPIRAPTRPAPVRRHQAPCHELNQLTTLWKPPCGNHTVETILWKPPHHGATNNNTAAAAGWSMK